MCPGLIYLPSVSWLSTSVAEKLNSGLQRNNSTHWSEWDLNPRPPHFKCCPLTTRPNWFPNGQRERRKTNQNEKRQGRGERTLLSPRLFCFFFRTQYFSFFALTTRSYWFPNDQRERRKTKQTKDRFSPQSLLFFFLCSQYFSFLTPLSERLEQATISFITQ